MNIEEEKKRITEEYEKQIAFLGCIPQGLQHTIRRASHADIWLESIAIEDLAYTLNQWRRHWGNYSLRTYFVCNDSAIACYKFVGGEEITITFTDDCADAIKHISSGKCQVIEKPKMDKAVICNL